MERQAQTRQSFMGHMQELRTRLLWPALSLFFGGVAGYLLQGNIQTFLVKPLNQPLYYLSPTGGFDFMLKICLFAGIIAALPVLIYNLLKFLEPAVPEKISFLLIKVLFSSCGLSALGILFAYFVSLPAALHFLAGFGSGQIQSLISTNEYFSFVMVYLAGFALLFQLPLILLFVNRITPLKPGLLMRKQRLVFLVSFVAAALITPTPDPFNQAIMAFPIILLYQISIFCVWIVNRREELHFEVTLPLERTFLVNIPSLAPVAVEEPAVAIESESPVEAAALTMPELAGEKEIIAPLYQPATVFMPQLEQPAAPAPARRAPQTQKPVRRQVLALKPKETPNILKLQPLPASHSPHIIDLGRNA